MTANGRPRYVEIAEHLRAVVAEGAAGDRLPSDAELCGRFGVSRMTARQAVATLEAEGLLYRRRGQGTFVAARPVPRRLGSPLSFTENLRRRGLVVTSRLLAAGWLDPDPEDVAALGLAPGERAVLVERLRLADGEPMAIERAVLSPSLAPVLATDLGVGSLHAAMEALGRLPTRADARVSARLADAVERRLLELHGASGVLLCERRVIRDQDGEPLEHTETRYVAERYVFEAVVTREEQGVRDRYLGLDLGGTNIKGVVVEDGADGLPVVVGTARVPTGAAGGPDAVAANMVALGRDLVTTHGPVAGAGIGVPGLFSRDTGTIELFPNLPGPWVGYPLRDRVAQGLGLRLAMLNDARAFTLAEGRVGAGRGAHTLVCMTLGTGVGGGIMIQGRLHLGAWGVAGEIAHQTIVPDGPTCGCGNHGCAEALTRADVLAALAGRASAEEVYLGASEGDPRCREAVDTVAGYLGIALANCVAILGPDRIVVGGGIAAAGELVLGPIRDAVHQRVTLVPTDRIAVVAAELGPTAGAIGVAVAALDGH